MTDQFTAAAEICSLENGKVLWVERWILKRMHGVGERFIRGGLEYEVVRSALTTGKHGGKLVEHVVRQIP